MKKGKISLAAIALVIAVSASAFTVFASQRVIVPSLPPAEQNKTQAVLNEEGSTFDEKVTSYSDIHCVNPFNVTCLEVTREDGTNYIVPGTFQ